MKVVAAILLLAVTACAEAPATSVALGICRPIDPAVGFAERDSAGVRIVENLSAAGDIFRVGPEAVAVIGTDESDPDDVIGRLAGAVLLEDGRVALADALSMQIRVHGRDGRLLGRFGGSGDGPGEFSRDLFLFGGPGDTLVARHEYSLKYARFQPDGTFLDGGYVTRPPGEGVTYHSLRSVFPTGGLLVIERRTQSVGGSTPQTQVRRGRVELRYLPSSTDEPGPPVSVPAADRFNYVHGRGEFEGSITFGDVPFGRVESWALGDSTVYVGDGGEFEVERRSASGDLTGLFRICEEATPVDPEELARAIEEHVARYGDRSARLERTALEGIPLPAVEPAHLEMHRDAAGRLWVRDFAPDWEDRTWRIFGEDGRWLGSVTTPTDLTILDIGTDRLLVSSENELGVETLRVHLLEGPS